MLIFDVYTDGEVRQNNGTYSYSYGKSPYTGDHIDISAVQSSGFVDYHGIHHHGSYGRIYTIAGFRK